MLIAAVQLKPTPLPMPYKDPKVKKEKHAEYSRKHYLANQTEIKQKTKKITGFMVAVPV